MIHYIQGTISLLMITNLTDFLVQELPKQEEVVDVSMRQSHHIP
jgi:hypothetical protein